MVAMISTHDLGMIPLFEGLLPEQLACIHEYLNRASFPAKTRFINVGLPDDTFYIILTGTVKICIKYHNNPEVILAILKPGEPIGELSIVDGARRSATAVTREKTELLWMKRSDFEKAIQAFPVLSHNLTRVLSRRLRLANAQIQSLSVQDVLGRVAHQLLVLAREYGEDSEIGGQRIALRLTQSEIASMVGAARERVNVALKHCKTMGYITEAGYYYTVCNAEALAQRCQ